MGAGGIIIIRQKVKETGGMDQVKDCQSPQRRARLESVLTKDVHDWTDDDFQFVLRCIGRTHDDC